MKTTNNIRMYLFPHHAGFHGTTLATVVFTWSSFLSSYVRRNNILLQMRRNNVLLQMQVHNFNHVIVLCRTHCHYVVFFIWFCFFVTSSHVDLTSLEIYGFIKDPGMVLQIDLTNAVWLFYQEISMNVFL